MSPAAVDIHFRQAAGSAAHDESTDVCCTRLSKVGPDLVGQWRDLHRNSVSPNIYLSPDFVIAARDTICDNDPLLVATARNGQLIGLAVLQANGRSPAFPLRSMKLFGTIHSFQSGILLRQGIAESSVDDFLHCLVSRGASNIEFRDFDMGSATAEMVIAGARRLGLDWYELVSYRRAALDTHDSLEDWQASRKKLIKEAARQRRRLAEQGQVSWCLLMPDEIGPDTIETFLSLEHFGWKGDLGTSLLSQGSHADFFRRLVRRFSDSGEVFFTELRLDGEAVASTVNFMSGPAAFAFKVGWDKRLARFGPGILNEIAFVEHVLSVEMPFRVVESGTNDHSFIERLWPGRTTMFTGYLVSSATASLVTKALWAARRLKNGLRRQQR